jgi:hypothetical protein
MKKWLTLARTMTPMRSTDRPRIRVVAAAVVQRIVGKMGQGAVGRGVQSKIIRQRRAKTMTRTEMEPEMEEIKMRKRRMS